MERSNVWSLATLVIVGVILADFIAGFYGPKGGGSGVIVSGISNLWTMTVDAMLGQAPADAPKGPNPPGSQKTPAPKAAPKPAPKKKGCMDSTVCRWFGICFCQH